MRSKLRVLFSKFTAQDATKTAELVKKHEIYGSYTDIKEQLQREIEKQGYDTVEQNLRSERSNLNQIAAEIARIDNEGLTAIYEKIYKRKAQGYEIGGAIRYLGQELAERGLDYKAKKPLVEEHDRLLERQLAWTLLNDDALESDILTKKKY